ncbi:hypothetical protein GQ600_1105 [Phytophthora cactorum]|nr:hypothetical protein GQ600_1105 [Phytophthora cactorum]
MMKVHVYMYEPLIDDDITEKWKQFGRECNKKTMTQNVKEKKGSVVSSSGGIRLRYQKASLLLTQSSGRSPQQPDSASCAQAHHYLTGNTERQSYSVSKNDLNVMCLRMFWKFCIIRRNEP